MDTEELREKALTVLRYIIMFSTVALAIAVMAFIIVYAYYKGWVQ